VKNSVNVAILARTVGMTPICTMDIYPYLGMLGIYMTDTRLCTNTNMASVGYQL